MQRILPIDGLRAVAVLPVLLYHFNLSFFGGGYIGVDIFFVISGFLITSIIYQELLDGKFSVLKFYERRARRILPALMLVLAASSALAIIFLPPSDFIGFSKSLIAVGTFTSNIYFNLSTDYFGTAANEQLLTHTWSLGVEEQFYIAFPLLMLLTIKTGKQHILPMIIGLSLCSLACSWYLSIENTSAGFYLIFSRAWELLIGASLALIPAYKKNNALSAIASLGALTIISIVITSYDSTIAYPGYHALLPVAATALIIYFRESKNWVNSILSTRILVFIGLISYSLYLWHFPILVLINIKTIEAPATSLLVAAMVSIFIAATLSWKFVESPFRKKEIISTKNVWVFSAITFVLFSTIGASGILFKGFPTRFTYSNLEETAIPTPMRDKCHTKDENYLAPSEACRYFEGTTTWAAIGDSHVAELSLALAEKLQAHNESILHLSFSDCPPAINFDADIKGCRAWLNEAVAEIIKDHNIENVLVGFRHVYHLYGNHSDVYPDTISRNPRRLLGNNFAGTDAEAENIYWSGFAELIARLKAGNKRVFILYPIPEIPLNIHRGLHPFSIFSQQPLINLEKSLPMAYYRERNKNILPRLNTISEQENTINIDPTLVLCDKEFCRAVQDGKTLYFDDDHPSISGARLISKLFDPWFEVITPNE